MVSNMVSRGVKWCHVRVVTQKKIEKAALIPIRLRLQLIKAYIPTYNCNHTYNRKSSI